MRNQSYKSHLGYVGMSAQTEDDASVCNAIVMLGNIRMMIELKHTSIKGDFYQIIFKKSFFSNKIPKNTMTYQFTN